MPRYFLLRRSTDSLKKKNDQIDQNTNAEQTGCEQIQNTGTNFALIELVAAKDAEEQAEKE